MSVLGEFQITQKQLTLSDAVIAEQHKIHVGDWLPGVQVPSEHLYHRLDIVIEASDGVLGAKEQDAEWSKTA